MFFAAALVPALPWFVKAQLETGNPLFPNAYGVFGADPEVWTAQADAAQQAFYDKFGYRDGFGSFIALPWDVTMHGAAFGGCIGVAYLVLLPLALLRRPSRPLVLTALFCVGYLVLWASPLSSLQMRFLVPVLGALAVVAATGFEAAWELARERVPAAAVVFAGVVLATLALALPPFVRSPRPRRRGHADARGPGDAARRRHRRGGRGRLHRPARPGLSRHPAPQPAGRSRRPGGDGDRPVRQLLRPARAGPRLRRLPGQRRALRR